MTTRSTGARGIANVASLAASFLCVAALAWSQPGLSYQRDTGRAMLGVVKEDLRKHYYDPSFRGVDIEQLFKRAEANIARAQSNSQIFGAIAGALIEFGDSHTVFLPPARANRVEYGFQMLAVGDKVFISAVKPRSDAEAKGLRVGDEVLALNGMAVGRKDLEQLTYIVYQIQPLAGFRLVLRGPDGKERQLDVASKVKTGALVTDWTGEDIWWTIRAAVDEERLNQHRYVEVGDDLLVWKMPAFAGDDVIGSMIGKARKRPLLILDLRGNSGGSVRTLERLVGYLFEGEVKIAELRGRKETKLQMGNRLGGKDYKGKLVVLVDSASASAAEVAARVMQLEKRGAVIGDRTAGAVMLSRAFNHELGYDTVVPYGVTITEADVVMSDGKSLEHAGVTPDELLLPSAQDLAQGRDPVLSRAAALLGVKLSAEEAGRLFPVEWAKY